MSEREQHVFIGRISQDPFQGHQAGICMIGGIIHVPVIYKQFVAGLAPEQQHLSVYLNFREKGINPVSSHRFINPVQMYIFLQEAFRNGFLKFLV